MKRFLAVMCVAALGAAPTVPATADTVAQKVKTGVQKTKDAVEEPQGVMAAQQALKDKGHDPGKVDGKVGPRTRAMLSDYQKAEGLKVTGQLDSDTRGKLGI